MVSLDRITTALKALEGKTIKSVQVVEHATKGPNGGQFCSQIKIETDAGNTTIWPAEQSSVGLVLGVD